MKRKFDETSLGSGGDCKPSPSISAFGGNSIISAPNGIVQAAEGTGHVITVAGNNNNPTDNNVPQPLAGAQGSVLSPSISAFGGNSIISAPNGMVQAAEAAVGNHGNRQRMRDTNNVVPRPPGVANLIIGDLAQTLNEHSQRENGSAIWIQQTAHNNDHPLSTIFDYSATDGNSIISGTHGIVQAAEEKPEEHKYDQMRKRMWAELDRRLKAVGLDRGMKSNDVAKQYMELAYHLLTREESDVGALELYEKALEIQKEIYYGDVDHPEMYYTYRAIGKILYNQAKYQEGKYEEAMDCVKKQLSIAEIKYKNWGEWTQMGHIAESSEKIGTICCKQRKYDDAMECFRKVLDIKLKFYAPQTASRHYQDYAKKLPKDYLSRFRVMFQRLLEFQLETLEEDHPKVAGIYHSMAELKVGIDHQYSAKDIPNVAIDLQFRALEIKSKKLGPDHSSIAGMNHTIGKVLFNQGKYEQAIQQYKKALEINLNTLGPEHSKTASTYTCIGDVLKKQGKYEQAMHQYQKLVEIERKTLGPEHSLTATTYHEIGYLLEKQGKYEDALDQFQKALDIKLKTLGPKDPSTSKTNTSIYRTYHEIGYVLEKQGKYKEAMKLYQDVLESQSNGPVWCMSIYETEARIRRLREKVASCNTKRRWRST